MSQLRYSNRNSYNLIDMCLYMFLYNNLYKNSNILLNNLHYKLYGNRYNSLRYSHNCNPLEALLLLRLLVRLLILWQR